MVTRCQCCIIFILPAYTHSSIPVWVTGCIIPNYTMHVNTKLGKSPCEKLDNNQADNFALYVNINYVDHRYLTQIVFNLLHTCYDQTACQLGKLLQNRLYWHDIVLTSLDTRYSQPQSLPPVAISLISSRLECRDVTLFILRLSLFRVSAHAAFLRT